MSSPWHFIHGESGLACPFFMPMEKLESGSWQHPSRLPLGCGWRGHCTAPEHDGEVPSEKELHDFCNLGYAEKCSRLPRERLWDSVRFDVRRVFSSGEGSGGQRIQVRYVCERDHLPADHGFLEFDLSQSRWIKRHEDSRVQRMAECFMASYREKARNYRVEQPAAS